MFQSSAVRSISRSARIGGSASPPISARKPGAPAQPASISARHAEGVACSSVAPCVSSSARSAAGSCTCCCEAMTTFAPHDQRQQQVEHRGVEGRAGDREHAVVGREPRHRHHAGQEVDHAAVRHAHALGLAGGARGVDQVGLVGRRGIERRLRLERIARAAGRREPRRPPAASARPARRGWRSRCRCVSTADRSASAAMKRSRSTGIVGVERHVGRAGLHHAELRDQHRGAALDAQAHALPARDAACAQHARQPVRAALRVRRS